MLKNEAKVHFRLRRDREVLLKMKRKWKINTGNICILHMLSALFLVCSFSTGMAEERYKGMLVTQNNGKYEIGNESYVELVIDQNVVKLLKVVTRAANKDLTFSSCKKLEDDGSNFSRWFSIECRAMESFNGTPFMHEYFIAGAYAGISPLIAPDYSMYRSLKKVSETLGLNVPERTFVIYADKKPVYEFFCYPVKLNKN